MTHRTLVHLDGELMAEEEAMLPALSPAFTSCGNVFETMRGYWNGSRGELYLFRLDDHLARFQASLAAMGYESAPASKDIAGRVLELVRASGFREDMHIRLLAYPQPPTRGLGGTWRAGIVIGAAPRPPSTRRGVSCVVSGWRRAPEEAMPAQVKCTPNYLTGRLASVAAVRDGYEEPILLNAMGKVAEGAISNIFLVKDDVAVTPDLASGVLEGITRASLLAILSRQLGIRCDERPVDKEELSTADELFFCSTGYEVLPILSVDGRSLEPRGDQSIAEAAHARYLSAARGDSPEFSDWLTPVYGELQTRR